MAERTTKYYQKCDFCHKEFKVSSGGLDSITLPGRYVDTDGSQPKQWIKADICPECKERLREYLAKAVDIREEAYYGLKIRWLNEKGEQMKIVVDKMPTKPSECFYAHRRRINEVSGHEYGICWIRGEGDWSSEACALSFDEPCPYLTEAKEKR